MQRPQVKICGLTTLEDARFAAGALADYLGFIFYEKSPRYIDPGKAGAIINWVEGPSTVGVFVNQPPDDVNMIVRQSGLDYVQLHGTESPEYCRSMEKPVIKVFHVTPDTTANELQSRITPYLSHVEWLMFDTKLDGMWGGTGEPFDWSVLKTIPRGKPFFLSGGLTPENISAACKELSPTAIDINSGVEQAPGIKDYEKLERLFEQLRTLSKEAGTSGRAAVDE